MICKQCFIEFRPNHAKYQDYCNWACYKLSLKKPDKFCIGCGNLLAKQQLKFCSKSCAASYNNQNRKTGYRRSKFEQYLEAYLVNKMPNEKILFNNKSVIGQELDVYFPNKNLAIEVNGVFHYKPVYGEEKLRRTQLMDKLKKELCHSKGIKLITIDISSQVHFSKETSKEFINKINEAIND